MPKLETPEEAPAETPKPVKKAAARKAAPPKAAPQTTSLLSQATTVEEGDEFVNALWYGPQGSGKTTNLAAMVNLHPTKKALVINAEGGLKKGALRRNGIDPERILVLPADPNDLTIEFLENLYWEVKADLESGSSEIIGVGWDSITVIVNQLVQNVARYQQQRAEARGESRVKSASPGDMVDQAFIDIADYGIMTTQVLRQLRKWTFLPCHVGVTALVRRTKDDDGKVFYGPDVTPALQNSLMGIVDIVAVTRTTEIADADEDEYQGLFRPTGKYRGKDRFKVLPKVLVDPTFDRIEGYVHGTLTRDEDPVMEAARERRAAAGMPVRMQITEEAAESGSTDEPGDGPTAEPAEADPVTED